MSSTQSITNTANPVVIITGASGGLGRELCFSYAKAGYNVVGLDIDQTALSSLQSKLDNLSGRHSCKQLDITENQACQQSVAEVIADYGRIDVLVNNAGITHFSKCLDSQPAVIEKVMAVNFYGAMYLTLFALPYLLKNHGSIVNLSSVAGYSPLLGRSGYCASKYAMHGFFETLRCEHMEDLHVLMVCPSFIATNSARSEDEEDNSSPISRPGRATQTVGKQATPAEVAAEIFGAQQAKKRLLLPGKIGVPSFLLHKFLPKTYEKIMLKQMAKEFV